MSKEVLKRLFVKGVVSYLAVLLLILTVAVPAIAVMAANSVNSAAIINGQVKTKDIGKRAVTAKKIALGAVRSAHIKDGSITGADIGDGSITNSDIAAGAAIADSKISYSTKTKRLSIAGDAFTPTSNSITYTKAFGMLLFGGGLPGWFSAPVSLPDGAKITGFRFNYLDNDSPEMTAVLVRRHLTTGAYESAATAGPTTGASADWRNLNGTVEKPDIDNDNYIYSAMIVFSGSSATMIAGGIIIAYEVNGP